MDTKITLDMLTTDSVSVKTQGYIKSEGTDRLVGAPRRKAYINSTKGRAKLIEELAEPYLTAVLAVWGAEPTIIN